MARLLLMHEDLALISDVFPSSLATGRPSCDPRRALNGILWVLRFGGANNLSPSQKNGVFAKTTVSKQER